MPESSLPPQTGRRSIQAAAWAQLSDWLPEMLAELLASEVYGIDIDRRPPKDQRGVYLFTERGKHLYVGRTSITAHSRARGGQPITSFRHRFDQHTQLGRPPGAASFANRLMLTIEGRKVARWRDYLDPLAVSDALGWPQQPR